MRLFSLEGKLALLLAALAAGGVAFVVLLSMWWQFAVAGDHRVAARAGAADGLGGAADRLAAGGDPARGVRQRDEFSRRRFQRFAQRDAARRTRRSAPRAQRTRPRAARRASASFPARIAARHRRAEFADGAAARRCARSHRLHQPRRAHVAQWRAAHERAGFRRDRRGKSAAARGRARVASGPAVHRQSRQRGRNVSPLAARSAAARKTASAAAGQAPHARAVAPGSADVEKSDPRHQPRTQQFARADFIARAFRPRARAARRRRKARESVRHDRGTLAPSRRFHPRLRRFRQTAATAPRRRGLERIPALAGAALRVYDRRQGAGCAGPVRPSAARTGDDQPAQERARIRRRSGRRAKSPCSRAARKCASKCAIAAPA